MKKINYSQPSITQFYKFTGVMRPIPQMPKAKRRRKPKVCRKIFPVDNDNVDEVPPKENFSLNLSSEALSLIVGISKRPLPVPILSDNERADENYDCVVQALKSYSELACAKPKVPMKLNKPSACSPNTKTADTSSKPSTSGLSTPKITSLNDLSNLSSSKKILILENTVLPKYNQSVKQEMKKVNYHPLTVLQEFFTNLERQKSLLSLLCLEDKVFLNDFFSTEKDYMFLCVKLFLRTKDWYNIFALTRQISLLMDETEIIKMYKCLSSKEFVRRDIETEDTFTLLNILKKAEITEIAKIFKMNGRESKDIVISKLLKLCTTQATLTEGSDIKKVLRKKIYERLGYCIKLSPVLDKCLYNLFLLNTYTNLEFMEPSDYFRDTTVFNVVFPQYHVENYSIFYTPQEFSRFVEAVKLRCSLKKLLEKTPTNGQQICHICEVSFEKLKKLVEEFGDEFDNSRKPHLERFDAISQYIYILTTSSKYITRKFHEDVAKWLEYLIKLKYCSSKRAYWYCRLSLIYTEYEKNYEKAAKLLIKALQVDKQSFTEVQLQDFVYRAKILNRKTYKLLQLYHDQLAELLPPSCDRNWPEEIVRSKDVESKKPGNKRVYQTTNSDGDQVYLTVEDTALQCYTKEGYPHGQHCENKIICVLFALLFWDIIYHIYVEGTLVSNIQAVPLDFYTKYFFLNRESFIKKRLEDLGSKWSEEEFEKRLRENWDNHSHERSLCQMDEIVDSPQVLIDVSQCIGRSILAKIFERFVTNISAFQSGFPDLIVWNIQEKKAKFVEVKSENDKLSIKQKLWLNYLLNIGASVSVCLVNPKSFKKRKLN